MVSFPRFFIPKHVLNLLIYSINPAPAFAIFDSATRQPNYKHSPAVFRFISAKLGQSKTLSQIPWIIDTILVQRCRGSEDHVLGVIKLYSEVLTAVQDLEIFQTMGSSRLVVIKLYSEALMAVQDLEIFETVKEVFSCHPGSNFMICARLI